MVDRDHNTHVRGLLALLLALLPEARVDVDMGYVAVGSGRERRRGAFEVAFEVDGLRGDRTPTGMHGFCAFWCRPALRCHAHLSAECILCAGRLVAVD